MLRFASKFRLLSLAILVGCALLPLFNSPTSALSGADWDAGRIISDDQFFKPTSMSTNDIQNFLNSMVPNCDTQGTQPYNGTTAAAYGTSRGYPPPYTCLKDYVENPTTHENNANGGSVSGGWSAAQIIKYASDTYSINPRALLVLLQKEQTLVTDSWPWTVQYRSATGYGCPDTAPCDAEYYGFYNQVTKAAYQFKRYATNASEYRYKAFQNNYIQWNPNADCGGSNVYITSQATAGLYNYTPYQPNTAALNNLYGSGDGCSAYGNRNFWRMYNDWFGSTQYEQVFLSYKSHVSDIGWTSGVKNSGTTGTTGQNKSMEAFKLNGNIEYSSYNFTTGWQPTVSNGMISGTTGQNKAIQAIKLKPTGELAAKYDVYYRAHVSDIGWMGWTKDFLPAGVTGDGNKKIEAFEIQLVLKGFSVSGTTANSYQNLGTATYAPPVSLTISSHVGTIGWQPSVREDMTTGTTEQNKQIEAVRIGMLNNSGVTGGLVYSSHVSGIGWQSYKSADEISGTTGQDRQMEAVRIALTGALSDSYDIWYRGHVESKGWMGWAKNGMPSGSVGAGLQLEAIEIRLVSKNSISLSQLNNLYNPNNQTLPDNYALSYSAHVSNVGWVSNIPQGGLGGTTGQAKSLEAIRLDSSTSIFGALTINCSASPKNATWTASVSLGGVCGTTGQARPLEAIRLSLSGEASNKFDIYYRVHLSSLGWQDWVKNDVSAGTPGSGRSIEAVVIKLVQK